MAEYVAGKGTTALGIIGTVLGSIGTAGVAGNGGILPGLTGKQAVAPYEMTGACMHDVSTLKELMAKDAEIAKLNSEKYSDKVGIELYKYIDGELKDIRATQNAKWTDQAVINATMNQGLTALSGQVTAVANTVNQITKVAVPQSSICNFGCCGCGCNN